MFFNHGSLGRSLGSCLRHNRESCVLPLSASCIDDRRRCPNEGRPIVWKCDIAYPRCRPPTRVIVSMTRLFLFVAGQGSSEVVDACCTWRGETKNWCWCCNSGEERPRQRDGSRQEQGWTHQVADRQVCMYYFAVAPCSVISKLTKQRCIFVEKVDRYLYSSRIVDFVDSFFYADWVQRGRGI